MADLWVKLPKSNNAVKAIKLDKAKKSDIETALGDGKKVEFLDSKKVIVPINGGFVEANEGDYLLETSPKVFSLVDNTEFVSQFTTVPTAAPAAPAELTKVTPFGPIGSLPVDQQAELLKKQESSGSPKTPKQGVGPAQQGVGSPPAGP